MAELACINCNNTFNGRADAKFCSPKCNKQYQRSQDIISDKPEQMSEIITKPVLDNPKPGKNMRDTLTKTDKTFYDRAIQDFNEPYYYFTGNTHKRTCAQCSKPYTTSLELNKYCSYHHFAQALHPAH